MNYDMAGNLVGEKKEIAVNAKLFLKEELVKKCFDFVGKYSEPGELCIYPQAGYILVNVLTELLCEAKQQIQEKVITCTITIDEWIAIKINEIGKKLPNLVDENPSSFECGQQLGYKAAMLELEELIESGAKLSESLCWCKDKYHDYGEVCL